MDARVIINPSFTAIFKEFNLIQAKVPILRFKDDIHKVEIDLNYNNCVGIRNTHLLHCYSRSKCPCVRLLHDYFMLNLFRPIYQWIGVCDRWRWLWRFGPNSITSTTQKIWPYPVTRWFWWWYTSCNAPFSRRCCHVCMPCTRRNSMWVRMTKSTNRERAPRQNATNCNVFVFRFRE